MKPISGASSFYLNDADLNSLTEKALSGDDKSAFLIYQHYEMSKGDIISAFPWLQIAANGKNSDAQYAMGYICVHVAPFKNPLLAKFWLNQASINGSIKAKDLLKEENLD